MIDLVEKLKGMLQLELVVRDFGVALERAGRKWKGCCPFHNEKTASFYVHDEEGWFKCFGCNKRGDVLNFIQLGYRLNDFADVLRKGCELAGLDYDRERGGESPKVSRGRVVGDILTAYVQLGATLWTPELRVRMRQHLPAKTYLTDDVISDWDLAIAPSVEQCEKAGISREQLRTVGLLKTSNFGDSEYMHFYNSILIPHMKNGRCVYIADRAIGVRGKDGKKKILNMPSPGDDGTGGVAKPLCFNLEAMWDARAPHTGVLLVEARLDAIACTVHGHPAIAYLDTPSEAFATELSKYKGIRLYYCPDGTADMTDFKRAQAAAMLGYDVKCCRLPEGKDPDDLSGAELAAVKAAAGDVVGEWMKALSAAA